MEKLSKLKINKSLNLSAINFNRFSSSKGWIGYFKVTDLSDENAIKNSSKIMREYFNIDDFFYDKCFIL
ncbi:hypothetical protein LU293_00020 [Moraxella nasovis]|uniref:hypothetical protein n=1 Tax=Moraxella nasovis TaxID=2904121 RepID=UPI001F6042F1|nr:hypothetical protein [Moraxella nasovis]UNU73339.1 hypothetical protein LU293_00020 [Moraxella nasovis]